MTVSISWAGWWFLNGHLFKDGETHNRKGDVRWRQWTCIFCGRHPHSISQEGK